MLMLAVLCALIFSVFFFFCFSRFCYIIIAARAFDFSRGQYNLEYYLEFARQLNELGIHVLAIKDMAGLLKPSAATALVRIVLTIVTLCLNACAAICRLLKTSVPHYVRL